MDADTISEEQTAIVRKNAFYTDIQCQHQDGGGRDYFCVPGCGDFESFFYVFCEKPGDGSHALYDENGVFPMLFVMAVMPAFNEEFLCRGILYGAYRQRAKTTGIWLSALAFGLFHLNFNQMLYAVYLGIVLALMVEATGSIYTSMLMHFLLNGFNVTMNFMANQRLIADAAVNQQQVTESVSQTLSDVPIQQLVTMAVVLAIFIFLNGILIYSTFRMNGRSLQNDGEKGRVIDGWIVIFVIITVILTYMNTDFL